MRRGRRAASCRGLARACSCATSTAPLVSLRVFASRLRLVTRAAGASLVINGDARLARDVGADGVHLGRDSGRVAGCAGAAPARTRGSRCRRTRTAPCVAALPTGADAVLVSPVFPSRPPSVYAASKEGAASTPCARRRRLAAGRIAVFALGGVDADNARACVEAGADGVAVVRALLASPSPRAWRGRSATHCPDPVLAFGGP